jgi:hypothetical protein
VSITWSQALAFRMRRHLLEPVGTESVAGVVGRLNAIPTMDEAGAVLAVRTRRQQSHPDEVTEALAEGRIIQSFAFRGGVHLLTPEDGGAYLALRCAGRQWELPSWQDYYELSATDWPRFREAVRDALVDGPLTITELGTAVSRHRAFRHLKPVFDDGAGTLVKPLTWQGDMSFGPRRDGRATFQRLDDNPRWAGVWDLDKAGPHAIVAYFRAYGPATHDHVQYWLGAGLSAGRKRLQSWLDGLSDRLAPVDVEGEQAFVLSEDVDELAAARTTDAVRLLPGHDVWVMGPGTKDPHVVPPARRTPVTRKAYLVVTGGVVTGTWTNKDDKVSVTWFDEHGKPPREALEQEVARLATILDRPLRMTVELA